MAEKPAALIEVKHKGVKPSSGSKLSCVDAGCPEPSQTPAAQNSPPELDCHRVRQILEEDNPGAKVDDVEFYTHQFLTYIEAAQNVLELGTIVAHPRGAPMENLYVKVRAASQGQLKKIKRLRKLNRLWTEARRVLDFVQDA